MCVKAFWVGPISPGRATRLSVDQPGLALPMSGAQACKECTHASVFGLDFNIPGHHVPPLPLDSVTWVTQPLLAGHPSAS